MEFGDAETNIEGQATRLLAIETSGQPTGIKLSSATPTKNR